MHHEVAVLHVGKIERRALPRPALRGDEPAGASVLVASEDFRIAQHGELRGGHGEAPRHLAELDFEEAVVEGLAADEFLKPLDLALVVEEHARAPSVRVPAAELVHELRAARFLEHEVAGFKRTNRLAVAGGVEIFLALVIAGHGAAGDPHIRARAAFQFHGDDEIVFADAFA